MANSIKSLTANELKAVQQQMNELGVGMMSAKEMFEEEKHEIKQETNFEHYKDEILECCIDNLAVVKGRPKLCYKTNCNDCDFKLVQIGCHNKVKDWLKKPYQKPTFKLTQFEYDLLQSYVEGNLRKCMFKDISALMRMKEKGHFKGIDDNELIGDILAKCEVVG